MNRERRSLHGGGLRAFEQDGDHYITLRAVKYGVVDDFGSVWSPGVFDRALTERMPTLAWAHNWGDPIGRAVSSNSDAEGPDVTFRLDDFDSVPRARQAYAQVLSGTIDDASVGFSNVTRRPPSNEEREAFPGSKEVILDADLDEVSLVLRGAVPGAKILALRSGGQMIDAEVAGQILARFGAGETDLLGALTAVKEAATDPTEPVEEPTPDPKEEEPVETDPPIEPSQEDFDADIDEALALTARLD